MPEKIGPKEQSLGQNRHEAEASIIKKDARPGLISYRVPENELGSSAQLLSEILGSDKWKEYERKNWLSRIPKETLKQRAQAFEDEHIKNWEGMPSLLILEAEEVERRSKALTALLGHEKWKNREGLHDRRASRDACR